MSDRKLTEVVAVDQIEPRILLIRGERVMLDADLAELYGVPTKRINERVKRNQTRFPGDFVWPLTAEEKAEVVANCDHLARLKFSRTTPYAFTEHGAIMAASVLNTPRAIEVSVYVVRAFVRLRKLLSTNKEFALRLDELERKVDSHDVAIQSLVAAIRHLMEPPPLPPRPSPANWFPRAAQGEAMIGDKSGPTILMPNPSFPQSPRRPVPESPNPTVDRESLIPFAFPLASICHDCCEATRVGLESGFSRTFKLLALLAEPPIHEPWYNRQDRTTLRPVRFAETATIGQLRTAHMDVFLPSHDRYGGSSR
jgi:hypothetical protein